MTENNKVVYNGQTLIDLTQDDVTASDVRSGVYFHDSAGVRGQGTLTSTSVPTADTIAEWDSDAHMNSTDMTSQEVDDFVGALNVSGINAVDYIVEQGTSGDWTYRKWNSGVLEQWLPRKTVSSYAMTTQRGSVYSGAWQQNTYPVEFVSFPTVVASACADTDSYVISAQIGMIYQSTIRVRGISSSSVTTTIYYSVYAVGKWK